VATGGKDDTDTGHRFSAISMMLAVAAVAQSQPVFTDITKQAGVALSGELIESVTIRWPSGIVQVLNDLEVDRVHSVVEREPLPAPLRRFPSRRVRP
jgi:hypothetical protein